MTGCDRVLERLRQGPATASELYAETHCMVHSRVADLRRRGYIIDCDKKADYLYRLLGERGVTAHALGNNAPLPEQTLTEPGGEGGRPPRRAEKVELTPMPLMPGSVSVSSPEGQGLPSPLDVAPGQLTFEVAA